MTAVFLLEPCSECGERIRADERSWVQSSNAPPNYTGHNFNRRYPRWHERCFLIKELRDLATRKGSSRWHWTKFVKRRAKELGVVA